MTKRLAAAAIAVLLLVGCETRNGEDDDGWCAGNTFKHGPRHRLRGPAPRRAEPAPRQADRRAGGAAVSLWMDLYKARERTGEELLQAARAPAGFGWQGDLIQAAIRHAFACEAWDEYLTEGEGQP